MSISANTPFELVFDQIRDLYSAEIQLRDSMPHLISLCTNHELQDLIVSHAQQNDSQIAELNAIFERHGKSPGDETCKAMAGLVEGGTTHLEGVQSPHTRDLMMVAHCLRVEYYEIAAYEITTLLAGRVGLTHEPETLSQLLWQEKDMAAALILLEPNLFKSAMVHA